MTGDKLNNLIY